MIWFVAFQNRIAAHCNGSNHFKTAHSVAKWLNLLLQSYFCSAQVFNGLKSFGWAKSTDQLNFRLLSKLGGDMKNYLCHAFRKIPDVLHVLWEELQKGKDAAAVTGDGVTDELREWREDGADHTTRPQDDTAPTFGGGVTWDDFVPFTGEVPLFLFAQAIAGFYYCFTVFYCIITVFLLVKRVNTFVSQDHRFC